MSSKATKNLFADGEAAYQQVGHGTTRGALWRLEFGRFSEMFANGFEAP